MSQKFCNILVHAFSAKFNKYDDDDEVRYNI